MAQWANEAAGKQLPSAASSVTEVNAAASSAASTQRSAPAPDTSTATGGDVGDAAKALSSKKGEGPARRGVKRSASGGVRRPHRSPPPVLGDDAATLLSTGLRGFDLELDVCQDLRQDRDGAQSPGGFCMVERTIRPASYREASTSQVVRHFCPGHDIDGGWSAETPEPDFAAAIHRWVASMGLGFLQPLARAVTGIPVLEKRLLERDCLLTSAAETAMARLSVDGRGWWLAVGAVSRDCP